MKKKSWIILIIVICLGILAIFSINYYVICKSKIKIISSETAIKLDDVDVILVLGCKVNDNVPSMMLRNRLDKGIEVYRQMNGTRLLLSGDHGQKEYDEVNVMRNYVLGQDIDQASVFLDHAGFSTYDSMYRAKEVFGVRKMIIVTQEYHLYRAIYIARKLGIDAYGVVADDIPYPMLNAKNNLREILARDKDFVKVIFKPSSKYVGDKIDLNGDSNLTWD